MVDEDAVAALEAVIDDAAERQWNGQHGHGRHDQRDARCRQHGLVAPEIRAQRQQRPERAAHGMRLSAVAVQHRAAPGGVRHSLHGVATSV